MFTISKKKSYELTWNSQGPNPGKNHKGQPPRYRNHHQGPTGTHFITEGKARNEARRGRTVNLVKKVILQLSCYSVRGSVASGIYSTSNFSAW